MYDHVARAQRETPDASLHNHADAGGDDDHAICRPYLIPCTSLNHAMQVWLALVMLHYGARTDSGLALTAWIESLESATRRVRMRPTTFKPLVEAAATALRSADADMTSS